MTAVAAHNLRIVSLLPIAILIVLLAGCDTISPIRAMTIVDSPISDTRVPDLSQTEAENFRNKYGMSSDLTLSGKGWEILSELDAWPDKMFEVVLLQPEEKITDDIYAKLAQIFLHDLDYNQMARYLGLCFDTYEYEKESEAVLLKGNAVKQEKIRSHMEQLAMDEKYSNRDMLYKFGLFTSIRYIPYLISRNPFQAFSIVEDVDSRTFDFEGRDVTIELNSLVVNYLGINLSGSVVSPQSAKIYQTAMDDRQLLNLSVFFSGISNTLMKEATSHRNLKLFESLRLKAISENDFSVFCANEGYAYAKIVYSDESLWPIRMVFPQMQPVDGFLHGERRDEEDESTLIVADWPVE
jgi:hypothetical protein